MLEEIRNISNFAIGKHAMIKYMIGAAMLLTTTGAYACSDDAASAIYVQAQNVDAYIKDRGDEIIAEVETNSRTFIDFLYYRNEQACRSAVYAEVHKLDAYR
jgi:hypothetical protein